MAEFVLSKKVVLATAVTAIGAAAMASVLTVWLMTYTSDADQAQNVQLISGDQTGSLAHLNVSRVDVKRFQPLKGDTEFHLTLHRKGEVTKYRGFHPDTVNMIIEIAPEGVARARYANVERSGQQWQDEKNDQAAQFFLAKAVEVARKVQAFDGKVVSRGR